MTQSPVPGAEQGRSTTPAEIEARIRARCEAQDYRDAAEIAIRAYGPEIMGYLFSLSADATRTGDAFSAFAEDLWQALPSFRWECALRSFAYGIARHALFRITRDPYRRRAAPLSQSPEVFEIAEEIRTRTAEHLRTDAKDRFAALREKLDPVDRELLVLRIDRRLSWQDVARIMLADEIGTGAGETEALSRAASKLRKRFERVKETLREHLVNPNESM